MCGLTWLQVYPALVTIRVGHNRTVLVTKIAFFHGNCVVNNLIHYLSLKMK